MKKQKSSDIRARIDFDLKQEFSDIFPDMSKKMIELIESSIENQKAYYLKGIKLLCSQDTSNIKTLEDIINYVCEKFMMLKQEDNEELKESNIIFCSSLGIPIPVSSTDIETLYPSSSLPSRLSVTLINPEAVNLTALPTMLSRICLRRISSR